MDGAGHWTIYWRVLLPNAKPGHRLFHANLVTLPVLTVFVVFQRAFVRSVVSSALKG